MRKSVRFDKPIILTHHAIEQMTERNISENILYELIETGDSLYKDDEHLWIYKRFDDRQDNLLCAAAIDRKNLVIKTVMINWELDNVHKIL